MNYKYKRYQIFGKRLKVPTYILEKIYNNMLEIEDFLIHELSDKIPLTCLKESDRKLVERFGIDRIKNLDLELLKKYRFDRIGYSDIKLKDLLIEAPSDIDDLNKYLYIAINDKISLEDYSLQMKMFYKDRFFDLSDIPNDEIDSPISKLKKDFNEGKIIGLYDIILNWSIFSTKDLDYCLMKTKSGVNTQMLRNFMSEYGDIGNLIVRYRLDIEKAIYDISVAKIEEEKKKIFSDISDCILDYILDRKREDVFVSNKEFNFLFKYSEKHSSIKEYVIDMISKFSEDISSNLFEELKSKTDEYIYNLPISIFALIRDYKVIKFVNIFGLDNIINFNNDCENIFGVNNCELLKSMYDMYLKKDNGNKFPTKERVYTKDEFYAAMRDIILFGPSGSNYKIPDFSNVTGEFRDKNPDLFIDMNAPKELQKLFYSKSITPDLLINNPEYIKYFNASNISSGFITEKFYLSGNGQRRGEFIHLYKYLSEKLEYNEVINFIIEYGDIISVFNNVPKVIFTPIIIHEIDNLDDIKKKIIDTLGIHIKCGGIYPKNISNNLKSIYSSLFLSENVPDDIKNKFYSKSITIDDFNENPDLLDIIGDTNVAYGFNDDVLWVSRVLSDSDNPKLANFNRLKIIDTYQNVLDDSLKNIFKECILETGKNIEFENINLLSEVLSRLSFSNSSEMLTFRKELARQLLYTENPIESLNKIEDLFIKNNIPIVGKIYSCFEILHPNFEGFDFSDSSTISPILKNKSNSGRKVVVFSDLIKASFGSNNRSVNSYLNNIEYGSILYEMIKSGQVQYNDLDESQRKEMTTFSKHLSTLYNNTLKGKNDIEAFNHTDDVVSDIYELSKKLSPNGGLDYNLGDRVISMFCHYAGIDTLEDAKNYINSKITQADDRNRIAANSDMTLEKDDYIKGIGDITYLKNILQNGSVAKEFLGESAGSDRTPLDTDLSRITISGGTIEEKINNTQAEGYGPIWFVLKNDERFVTTRYEEGITDEEDNLSKIEAFYTGKLGEGHYGIRTGFASSEINYIVVENYDERVGLEIAMNGFYIPVADKEGKIVFTPNDYDKLRAKMSGLSYYGENNYKFSDNLITEDVLYIASQLENNSSEVLTKRNKITKVIDDTLKDFNLGLKYQIDGDLTEGTVELIDTGSTGRGTNKPGDGDFDFMMRLDRKILSDSEKINSLKRNLLKRFNKENTSEITWDGNFRLDGVQLDSETNVDIDITFIQKTDKVSYSTDMCIQDRFSTIKAQNPEKYPYVVANIILAKQVLKEAGAYKPNRGENPQGGLGGVGVENWILQNGGSFIDAANDFLKTSNGKTFDEFKKSYSVWDFGENHMADKESDYLYDNFVANNMSKEGYNKMRKALLNYINSIKGYNKMRQALFSHVSSINQNYEPFEETRNIR